MRPGSMRIVHVTPRFPPAEGGGERHAANVTSELAKLGHDVTVVTTKLMSELPQRLAPDLEDEEKLGGVRVQRAPIRPTGLPLWGYGFKIPGIVERVDRLTPDIVHLHGYGYHFADVLARERRSSRWKLVMTSHGFISGRGLFGPVKTLYDKTRGRRTVRALDGAIAISPRDREVFLGRGARRCEVIPNGVEFERFADANQDPALLARLGLAHDHFILCTSRLERLKGQDLLIKAFSALMKEHPAVKLVLVGEGSAEGELRELANTLRVGDRAVFAGKLRDSELPSLTRSARAFALTARDEPFGIVLLEAMAAGVPTLATGVGGVPYATSGAALLCGTDVHAIEEGLERLLEDDALRKSLAERGQKQAMSLTWPENARKVEALYRQVRHAS